MTWKPGAALHALKLTDMCHLSSACQPPLQSRPPQAEQPLSPTLTLSGCTNLPPPTIRSMICSWLHVSPSLIQSLSLPCSRASPGWRCCSVKLLGRASRLVWCCHSASSSALQQQRGRQGQRAEYVIELSCSVKHCERVWAGAEALGCVSSGICKRSLQAKVCISCSCRITGYT
jgi:hypothetical protein